MRFIHKLICLARGHVPLEHVTVEEVPAREVRIGGVSLNQLNNGTVTLSNPGQVTLSAGQIQGLQVGNWQVTSGGGPVAPVYGRAKLSARMHENDGILQVISQGLSSTLCVCARCHGVYWRTEPHLPALTATANVPELEEYRKWKQRELYEREQRETNEAAGKLYKQYRMVLKLAGPQCDDPEAR